MTIEPALTAEQWDRVDDWNAGKLVGPGIHKQVFHAWNVIHDKPSRRHMVAGIALNGQPFGFTYDDVQMLRDHAEEMHRAISAGADGEMLSEAGVDMERLADRIAALLPPEEVANG